MSSLLPPREIRLLVLVLVLLAVAVFAPPVAQVPGFNDFADQHARWGLPHALNVLSNLPFLLVGAACLWTLARLGTRRLTETERALLALTGVGLMVTAGGSAWYHLAPDDVRLMIDRSAMAVAFAGLLGLAGCRISSRAGIGLAMLVLVAGPVAVQVWAATGNLLPWGVLQGGGLLVLLLLAGLRNDAALRIRWSAVIGIYALAKLLELGDGTLWAWTGGLLSGHSAKHVVAALAGLPVLLALERLRRGGQNACKLPRRAACSRRSPA